LCVIKCTYSFIIIIIIIIITPDNAGLLNFNFLEGKRGPKRTIFCILPLHLISGTGFSAGRPVVPDVWKHRGAFIISAKRSKKGRENILLTVTITWVLVTEHDFNRLAQTDVTSSSYRWMFLANGRAHYFSSLTAKTEALRPFERSLFTH